MFFKLSQQKQLSQFFRNARRKSTPKGEVSGSSDSSKVNSCKRVKLFNDDPEAQKRNLELLENARAGTMSKKSYVILIEETFAERRTFVTKTAGSSAEVLEMCPYLGKQEHVSDMICIGFFINCRVSVDQYKCALYTFLD